MCRACHVTGSPPASVLGKFERRLEDVAPHLFECDRGGVIEHAVLSGMNPGEIGFACESDAEFSVVFRHFRRFLTVVRERDRRRVLFRFYDPRILRTFLPVCTPDELKQFFGPVSEFH